MSLSYYKADTFVHRLNPISKIVLTIAIIVLAIVFIDMPSLLILFGVVGALWIIARIPIQRFNTILKVLVPLFIIIIIMDGFLGGTHGDPSRRTTPIFTFFNVYWMGSYYGSIYLEGLLFGVSMVLRILCIVGIAPILLMTTKMKELTLSFDKLKIPFTFSFLLLSTATFTTRIFEIYKEILESQKLRAFDVEKFNLIDKVRRGYIPVVAPLVMSMLRQADDLQIAIETRCFGAPVKRTSAGEFIIKTGDYLMITITLILMVASLVYWLQNGSLVSNIVPPWLYKYLGI